jgi:perosamine synthetase
MIPVSKPLITDRDVRFVADAVSSGWVSSIGPFIDRFEHDFAKFCDVRHCITTSNGTVALHLALQTLDIGPGDEVIVPDLTFVATANAVVHAGATPVFADVSYSDWCLDIESVESLITPQTKAIIPVHLYGHPANLNPILSLASKYNLHIIEDAAEAHGAEYMEKKVGGYGSCGIFSFYANKIITTGEGGAITTNSDDIAERARFLRDHAMSKTKRYWHTEVGFNYRMTNMQAALGVNQISQIESLISQRDSILDTYRELLLPHGLKLNPKPTGIRPVNWLTCVLLEGISRDDRDAIISRLSSLNIDTRPFFYPLSSFPMFKQRVNKVAYDISSRGICLPTYPGLLKSEIRYVCRSLLSLI